MGRPREFDEQEVLDKALQTFWARGYEATSVRDLMAATGLAKGSLYKGFGDKRSLFLLALDAYLERGRESYQQTDDPERPAIEVLRTWLLSVAALATDGEQRRGCFGVNSVTELGPHDADVLELLDAHEAWLQRAMAATIARGIDAGDFDSELRPAEAARWITTAMGGLLVKGKLGISRREANRMVDYTLKALSA